MSSWRACLAIPFRTVTPNLHETRGGEPENPKRPHMTVTVTMAQASPGAGSGSGSGSDSDARTPANVNEPIDVPSGAAAG